MIALFALIAVIVVVGGGVEVLRRARFGVGPSAAHHRALDTLGHITNQNADASSELVQPDEAAVLSHVRRAVEGDPAQPRIEPQPVSRPVAVPAITGGPNFVGTIPAGHLLGRGPDTEIEGVRLLLPEPEATAQPEVQGDDGDEDWDDEWPEDGAEETWRTDEADPPGARVDEGADAPGARVDDGPEVGDRPGDDVRADDEDEDDGAEVWDGADAGDDAEADALDGAEAWGDAEDRSAAGEDTEVAAVVAPDATGSAPTGPTAVEVPAAAGQSAVDSWDDRPDEDGWEGVAGWESILHEAGGHPGLAWGGDGPDAVRDPDEARPDPVTAATGHDVTEETTAVVAHEEPDRTGVARIDDLGGRGPAGADEAGAVWATERSLEVPTSEPEGIEPQPLVEVEAFDDDAFDEANDEGPVRGDGGDDGDDVDENGDHPAVVHFDDLGAPVEASGDAHPEVRPKHIAAGPSRHSGAIPGLTPDETRAQLAALVQSGGMGAAAAGERRGHRRRRRSSQPRDHRRVISSAAMILVAVLVLGGAVFLVTSQSGSSPGRRTTAARPTAPAPAATTTTTPPPAALVSQTSSTATYQVTGSPMISLSFNSECWTEARQGSSSGPILFEGTQVAGAQKQLDGPVWIRLGNPTAVSVSVGGATISEPAVTAGNPFNLQFQ
jgi:hypothetical protein